MIATGDLKGSLRKLEACLRSLKYPQDVNYEGLARGDPDCFLPIVSHALVSFSPYLTEHLMGFSVELTGATDLRFVESVYKILRDLFSYKPQLTKQQFLQYGFAERKISLVCDIINFAIQKHKELSKAHKPANLPPRRIRFKSFPTMECRGRDPSPSQIATHQLAPPAVLQCRPLVERHRGSVTPILLSLSSDDQEPLEEDEMERSEVEEEEEEEEGLQETVMSSAPIIPPALEARLQAMETQLQHCEQRLAQLAMLEGRLQALESSMAGKVVLEQSHWENLESRVLLLETRLALSQTQQKSPVIIDIVKVPSLEELSETGVTWEQEDVRGRAEMVSASPPASPNTTSAPSASSPPPHAQENIKERLERIANMMKDTSSLLQNVEPSI